MNASSLRKIFSEMPKKLLTEMIRLVILKIL